MKIDYTKCVNCGRCEYYCPVEAIERKEDVISIDLEKCVECGVCLRSGACRTNALYMQEMFWPRSIRASFSGGGYAYGTKLFGPREYGRLVKKASLPRRGMEEALQGKVPGGGRGTDEMKTNDITGRFGEGKVGIGCEMGRPGVGFYFRDMEKVTTVLSKFGDGFEEKNPINVFIDPQTGLIREEYNEIKDEKALSAVIEYLAPQEKVVEIFRALEEVAKEIDTVFTVDIINKCKDGKIPVLSTLEAAGIKVRINGKTNMGLGRPLA